METYHIMTQLVHVSFVVLKYSLLRVCHLEMHSVTEQINFATMDNEWQCFSLMHYITISLSTTIYLYRILDIELTVVQNRSQIVLV